MSDDRPHRGAAPDEEAEMKARAVVFGLFLCTAVLCGSPLASAATTKVCPPGGLFDTTVRGGLLVTNDNYCILDGVTVYGGVTIVAGSDVDLEGATVTGGVHVLPGGEIEVDPGSVFGDNPRVSTIRGGMTLRSAVDWDIETARISGAVRILGGAEANPTFCGNTIMGGLTVQNVSTSATWFGDPADEDFECPGNTVTGSVSIRGSSFLEFEGNRIGGSIDLEGSTLEANGNHIGGSLLCSGGTTIVAGEPGDPSGNTVHGSNTC
jgi:hypothetical protein